MVRRLYKAHAISEDSDQAAQADLSLRWPHKSHCRFYRALAHFTLFSEIQEKILI